MKKFLPILLFTGFVGVQHASAQAFITQYDTVKQTVGNTTGILNNSITNKSFSSLKINWYVSYVDSSFPSDWLDGLGVCDNNNCYKSTASQPLYKAGGGSTVYTSNPYGQDSAGFFAVEPAFSSTSTVGTHTLQVTLTGAGYTKITTYIITHPFSTSVTSVNNTENNIILYPNPVSKQLNVVFNANTDVKNIAIYNIIGKLISVYRVTNNNAGMDVSSLPAGTYFIHLINSDGNVITTRRFTHQ